MTDQHRHPDPLIQAWRDYSDRYVKGNPPAPGTDIREAFAGGWDAALAARRESVLDEPRVIGWMVGQFMAGRLFSDPSEAQKFARSFVDGLREQEKTA